MTITAREVRYQAGGRTCHGSLMVDERRPEKRPGVVVFPEFWGINDYARSRARMLAEQGYVALAADVYGDGTLAKTSAEGGALMMELRRDPDLSAARIRGAVDALASQPEVDDTRLSAIGYCLGGAMALGAARLGLPLCAVASFHGVLDSTRRATPGGVHAKVLVCHAGADAFISAESIAAFHQEMHDAGVDYEFVSYPGVRHAFTDLDADIRARAFGLALGYDARADRASWAKLLTFLSRTLDA
ncbi:MAG: dienelactone hydrolase family protein [Myxococcota bacterium]